MGEREVDSKCGWVVAHSLHDCYNCLDEVQHRGQDAAGIFCLKEIGKIDGVRWEGKVRNFDREALERILERGYLFFGEVRYSTNRGKLRGELLNGALPRYFGGEVASLYEYPYLAHMVVRNSDIAMTHNGHFRGFTPRGNDTDTDVAMKFYAMNPVEGVERIIETFPATYSAGILDSKKDYAAIFKDRFAIRPLWIGEKDGRIVAASEDHAISRIGGNPIREVSPGELIKIFRNGTNFENYRVLSRQKRPCFFERMYLGARSSSYNGISNKDTRRRGGAASAYELLQLREKGLLPFDLDSIDFISYIPKSPIDYARAIADILKKPLLHIFYKIDSTRAFLGADEERRGASIEANLCVDVSVDIAGKRGLFVEDSIVRFNNARHALRKLVERGISWKGLLSATPPLGPIVNGVPCGCEGGIDMPPNDNFAIRRYTSIEEMASSNGWDFIYYLSKQALGERVLRRPLSKCCARCIGEDDPVSLEDLAAIPGVVEEVYKKFPPD